MRATKAERTQNLRYKRPALASMGADDLTRELGEIQEACAEIHWFVEQDDETLLNALDGEEEDAFEFRMAFSDLEAKAERLGEELYTSSVCGERVCSLYNDCTVALIGNRYKLVGYDWEEEDYFSLTSYDKDLACQEAGKRLMRLTKAEMLSTIGQCVGILIAFLDVRQSFDYLKATFDILRDVNTSLLDTIKAIDAAYETAGAVGFFGWHEETKAFDRLLDCLPDRAWIE